MKHLTMSESLFFVEIITFSWLWKESNIALQKKNQNIVNQKLFI